MRNRVSGMFILALLPGFLAAQSSLPPPALQQDEVYYHIFTRSFFDSNGDSIGYFPGIPQQLGYLESLGVTSLWISPIPRARSYHNYFADDFDSVDAAFGSREGFFALVREVHKRGMKILLDMETQYVTERHPWFVDSHRDTTSPYGPMIWYNGPGNTRPESGPFGLEYLPMYRGDSRRMISLDMYSSELLEYNRAPMQRRNIGESAVHRHAPPATDSLAAIARDVVACNRCPRLRQHCAASARTKRRAYRTQEYWGKPVPGFGSATARLWILGLAPAAHGANRTGRMFTGDGSGDFLYRALHPGGFASQARATSVDDGLTLEDLYVLAVCRCAPPGNKPSPQEIANCLPYLEWGYYSWKTLRASWHWAGSPSITCCASFERMR